MNRNAKLNHMLALTEEINVLTQRIKPQATGHIHTTINTLRERVGELKKELSGNMLQDLEIRDKIHRLEMKLNNVKPTDSHFNCVGCGA